MVTRTTNLNFLNFSFVLVILIIFYMLLMINKEVFIISIKLLIDSFFSEIKVSNYTSIQSN